MFRSEDIDEKQLDTLIMYIVPATIIGARMGHVFFYDLSYYKNHLADIPKVWEGGLASHGAAIMILIALYIFSKRVAKQPMLWILDRIVAPIAIAGCFIRLGNLVNQEIVGIPTTLPWGFRFSELAFQQEYLVDDKFIINDLLITCGLELVDTSLLIDQYHIYNDFMTKYYVNESKQDTLGYLTKINKYYDKNDEINRAYLEHTSTFRMYVLRKRDDFKPTKTVLKQEKTNTLNIKEYLIENVII
jgi:prolipoprotein diacylglyceryl transferase